MFTQKKNIGAAGLLGSLRAASHMAIPPPWTPGSWRLTRHGTSERRFVMIKATCRGSRQKKQIRPEEST